MRRGGDEMAKSLDAEPFRARHTADVWFPRHSQPICLRTELGCRLEGSSSPSPVDALCRFLSEVSGARSSSLTPL